MPGLILKLIGWGVPAKLARPLIFLAAALLLASVAFGSWKLWLHFHDRGVIAQHESDVGNQITAETAKGTAKADAAENVSAARDNAQSAQVREDIHNATIAHPKESRASAGPASSAALNRLRAQHGR
jgi:type IV secretory pathway VirB4 component